MRGVVSLAGELVNLTVSCYLRTLDCMSRYPEMRGVVSLAAVKAILDTTFIITLLLYVTLYLRVCRYPEMRGVVSLAAVKAILDVPEDAALQQAALRKLFISYMTAKPAVIRTQVPIIYSTGIINTVLTGNINMRR